MEQLPLAMTTLGAGTVSEVVIRARGLFLEIGLVYGCSQQFGLPVVGRVMGLRGGMVPSFRAWG